MNKKLFFGLLIGLLFILPVSNLFAFSDVNSSTYYKTAIDWMQTNGVIQGYSDGTFRPDNCVNRVEILKMLYLVNETPLYNQEGSAGSHYYDSYFSDTNVNEWYWPYLNTALRNQTVQGYSDRTFKPNQCVNRVEAVKIAVLEFNDGSIPIYDGGLWSFHDVDRTAWYAQYLIPALFNNYLGLNHMQPVGNEGGNFFPGDSMTRKEVAEMLYRMKALKDNGVQSYDSTMTPMNLIPASNEIAFDGCGSLSLYSSLNWYPSFLTSLESQLSEGSDLSYESEGCLSLDGGTFIAVVYHFGTSQVFKFDVKNYILKEASYTGFLNTPILLKEFLKRVGDYIPMQGECGDICGNIRVKANYYYARNVVQFISSESL